MRAWYQGLISRAPKDFHGQNIRDSASESSCNVAVSSIQSLPFPGAFPGGSVTPSWNGKGPYGRLQDGKIRLLVVQSGKSGPGKLRLRTFTVSLARAEKSYQYEALSYVWGQARDSDQHTITLNGKQVTIGRNLARALNCIMLGMEFDDSKISTSSLVGGCIVH